MSQTRTTENCSKKVKTAQAFGQYGSTAAGTTGFALDVMGLCVPIPKPLKIGLSTAVGVLFGCIGGCNEYKKGDVDERQDREISEIRQHLHLDKKDEMDSKEIPPRDILFDQDIRFFPPIDMVMDDEHEDRDEPKPVVAEKKRSIR